MHGVQSSEEVFVEEAAPRSARIYVLVTCLLSAAKLPSFFVYSVVVLSGYNLMLAFFSPSVLTACLVIHAC